MTEKACSSIGLAKQQIEQLTNSNSDSNNNSNSDTGVNSTLSLSDFNKGNVHSSNVHFQYASAAYDVRMLNRDITNIMVTLNVQNLMIVTKLNDVSLYYLTREVTQWLLTQYPEMTVFVDEQLQDDDKFAAGEIIQECHSEGRIKYWTNEFINKHDVFFDLVVTLGGDGTVLFVSSIFQQHVPPVLSFSLGSLGFLTNFKFEQFQKNLQGVINQRVKTNLRLRLECKLFRRQSDDIDSMIDDDDETRKKRIVKMKLDSTYHVLNELTVDRGPSPFLSMLELYGNDSLMTVAQADGLIIATPTGSTAYSLSAGGSLMYPTVNAIAVTPICPHTLSFRPLILPDTIKLKIKASMKSRNSAWVSFDGKNRVELNRGDYITVSASPYWFPTVEAHASEFIDSISRQLNWNVREQQKSFTHMLTEKNKENYENLQQDEGNVKEIEEVEVEEE